MSQSAEKTYLEAVREALTEALQADERVFLLGEDIGQYGGAFKVTEGLFERFGPRRVIDTPIAEGGIAGMAVGAALMGLRPIVEMQFMDFISCAFNQLTNVAAKWHYRLGEPLPLVVRGPGGGGVGGGPFHSQSVEQFFTHTPGLKVVTPATAEDAKILLKAALADPDPVIFIEHKRLYRDPALRQRLPGPEVCGQLGQALWRRAGEDLAIISYGATVHDALAAAAQLEQEGLSVGVLDLRSLRPLDEAAVVAAAQRYGKILVAHEDQRTAGFAAEICARVQELAFEWLDAPVLRVTAADVPIPTLRALEREVLPQVADLCAAARQLAAY